MGTHDTEISSLTTQADLTAIHEQSDLTTVHTSRHTTTGFLVDGPLLRDWLPTPGAKRGKESWIWAHGESITNKKADKRHWLCRLCYNKEGTSKTVVTLPTPPTTPAIRHLVKEHSFGEDGTMRLPKRKANSQDDMPTAIRRQLEASTTTVNASA